MKNGFVLAAFCFAFCLSLFCLPRENIRKIIALKRSGISTCQTVLLWLLCSHLL
jgi:hypothetical protein